MAAREQVVMLDVDTAPAFLIDRGLIDQDWILDGHLRVRARTRRNHNLRVEGPGGAGFLIKQPGAWEDSSRETLRREAAFHRLCREEPALAAVAEGIPPLVADDPDRPVLVFEAVPGAVPLHPRRGNRSTEPAFGALGRALGRLHRVTRFEAWGTRPRPAWLDRGPPWSLGLHEPRPHLLTSLGPARLELLRILQASDSSRDSFGALRDRWQPVGLVHGDIRFDNVLVGPPGDGAESESSRLWIVDWETVGVGDPAWDLAGAFQDLIVHWVSSMPISDEFSAEQWIARAALPMELMNTLARALWSGYREEACPDGVEAAALLVRTVAYSAGRLIQTVFETLAGAERLAGRAVVLLQVAANLLAEPASGQVQLYGIPREPAES
jgi:Ser/Thr protein kinase RdoA (MazF antagonist)